MVNKAWLAQMVDGLIVLREDARSGVTAQGIDHQTAIDFLVCGEVSGANRLKIIAIEKQVRCDALVFI